MNITIVVIQAYEAEADNEYVIRGNPAVMKCEIPSYVSDFVYVDLWMDSDGGTYYPEDSGNGIERRKCIPTDEPAMRAISRYQIPSKL